MRINPDISDWLRRNNLLAYTDLFRYSFQWILHFRKNKQFRQENPFLSLPPDYVLYESFQLDYRKYYSDSYHGAVRLTNLFKKHLNCHQITILDWGCGAGRMIRHLPKLLGLQCKFIGTDSNSRAIAWCVKHLAGIFFNLNGAEAALPYPDHSFDAIYGLSVFKHLSEQSQHDWFKELCRVLKPGGILLLSTQGVYSKETLSMEEMVRFEAGELVVRANVDEGHRLYHSYHPEIYMRKLFEEVEVLAHIVADDSVMSGTLQDIWMVRK